MNINENLTIGIEGLRSHLLRSFLSMLGIIFGVGAVIAMLSIGEGAKQQALEQIQLMGIKNIIIQDVPEKDEKGEIKRSSLSMGLTFDDSRMLFDLNPLVDLTVPVKDQTIDIQYGRERTKASVVGTMPEFADAMNYLPAYGTFFNYEDVKENRRVCVLGSSAKKTLFFFRDPLGKSIKIGTQWFTVIGVMEDKAFITGGGGDRTIHDLNQDVYIPISTAMKRFPKKTTESEISRVIARVSDLGQIQQAANILKKTLDRRHNSVQDYRITIPEELLKQSQKTQRIFNIVMGAIAGISLLVGGIGIMNIMLAAVLERTREIGIRRATGAKRADILSQFLFESVILSFAGGLIGIVVGFGLTKIIAMYANWRTIVSWEAIALSFCVSVGVGIVFGVYPARRAARMNPIEALRYE